jgi:hypothetical protein
VGREVVHHHHLPGPQARDERLQVSLVFCVDVLDLATITPRWEPDQAGR